MKVEQKGYPPLLPRYPLNSAMWGRGRVLTRDTGQVRVVVFLAYA
jgi:hypothetical protein